MNTQFKEKALNDYPVIKEWPELKAPGLIRRLCCLNSRKPEYILDGKREVHPALARVMSIIEEAMESDLAATWCGIARWKNVFLATECRNDAKKDAALMAALHLLANLKFGTGEEEDEWFDFDEEMIDEDGNIGFDISGLSGGECHVVCFNLAGRKKQEEGGVKDQTPKEAIRAMMMEGKHYSFFEGLSPLEPLQDQLDQILVTPGFVRFVCVSREMARSPKLQEMIKLDPEHNLCLELPAGDMEYYVRVCRTLLEGSGAGFANEDEMREALLKMKRRAGEYFSEEWIGCYLDLGREGERILPEKMFADELFMDRENKTARGRLEVMTGLNDFKKMIRDSCALVREMSRNPRLKIHRNMIFAGNPGCGKTTAAKLTAEIFAEMGASEPVYVAPDRSDLVGRFIGHTAPKIRAAFESARGGILFVDEAGYFLDQKSGGFVQEAIREFVRYMEIYPDVTVIFAMYSSEVSDFLSLDEGLRSRISRIVKFEDYSCRELCDITEYMLKENGYAISGGRKELEIFFRGNRMKEDFGNARSARKTAESIMLSFCVAAEGAKKAYPGDTLKPGQLTPIPAEQVKDGIKRLEREIAAGQAKNGMGFLPSRDPDTYFSQQLMQEAVS